MIDPVIPIGESVTEWAMENGSHFSWKTAADNYEPMPRLIAHGQGWTYPLRNQEDGLGIVLDLADSGLDIGKARVSSFLWDNGLVVNPYYVASYHPLREDLILHPFPTNYDFDGQRKIRANDGRPVDMSGWMVGPRTMFHLKVFPQYGEK